MREEEREESREVFGVYSKEDFDDECDLRGECQNVGSIPMGGSGVVGQGTDISGTYHHTAPACEHS